jgi:hypothetical protein
MQLGCSVGKPVGVRGDAAIRYDCFHFYATPCSGAVVFLSALSGIAPNTQVQVAVPNATTDSQIEMIASDIRRAGIHPLTCARLREFHADASPTTIIFYIGPEKRSVINGDTSVEVPIFIIHGSMGEIACHVDAGLTLTREWHVYSWTLDGES